VLPPPAAALGAGFTLIAHRDADVARSGWPKPRDQYASARDRSEPDPMEKEPETTINVTCKRCKELITAEDEAGSRAAAGRRGSDAEHP